MNQRAHQATGAGTSQCARILARLQEQRRRWVPMPELYRVSGAFAVHSRISDLRKRDFVIEQKNEHQRGGVIKSFYRLIRGGHAR